MQARVAARVAAIVLASLAYVAGSHWLMTQTEASAWNVVGVLSPMLLLIALGTWRGAHRWVGVVSLLSLLVLCALALWGIQVSSHALYLAQHAGINFFLAIFFGSTLRPGHTALITAVALRVHRGRLSPGHLPYTRKLTLAWVVFFLSIVVVSLLLYAYASFETWAVFANIVTPIATGLMFGVEHLMRYRLHPEFERASVVEAVRAYMQGNEPPARPLPRHSAP